MSLLSCRVGMKGIRELLDGKIWEWDLSFRWEWESDVNGNEVVENGREWYDKSVPAHLYTQYMAGSLSLKESNVPIGGSRNF